MPSRFSRGDSVIMNGEAFQVLERLSLYEYLVESLDGQYTFTVNHDSLQAAP